MLFNQSHLNFSLGILWIVCTLLLRANASTVIELDEEYGIIESPHYPQTYQDDEDITWHITAPEGYQIVIYFTSFDLEDSYDEELGGSCVYDYVQVLRVI